MKLRLMDLIVCPLCKAPFELKGGKTEKVEYSPVWRERILAILNARLDNSARVKEALKTYETEVVSGTLRCDECSSEYPIEGGIPRLLSPELRTASGEMGRGDPLTDTRIEGLMDQVAPVIEDRDLFMRIQKANQSNYGYEWQAFSHEYQGWEDIYKRYSGFESEDFFPDKLGLDAGCGMGRFPLVAVKHGAEMVGLDLSNAIEAAYVKSIGIPTFHAVQGDIFNLPFRDDFFDFAESLGVIHITPDPEGALDSIRSVTRKDSRIFLYVYNSFEDENLFKFYFLKAVNLVRKLTVKVPSNFLYWMLYPMVPVVYACLYLPSRMLWAVGLKGLSMKFPYSFEQYRGRRIRDFHMNLFDRFGNPVERRYNRREMTDWMERADIDDYKLVSRDGWVVSAVNRK